MMTNPSACARLDSPGEAERAFDGLDSPGEAERAFDGCLGGMDRRRESSSPFLAGDAPFSKSPTVSICTSVRWPPRATASFPSVLSLRDEISETCGEGMPPKKRPANVPAVLTTLSMELLRFLSGDAALCLTGVTEWTGVVDLMGVAELTGVPELTGVVDLMGVVELTGVTESAYAAGGSMRAVESRVSVELMGVAEAEETGVTELTGPVKLTGTAESRRPADSGSCSSGGEIPCPTVVETRSSFKASRGTESPPAAS
jgi:hypothetical protein